MTVIDRALWTIERNSNQSLSLRDVADASGVSRSHLAAAFGTATGQPVMKYLRARRLSAAAKTLAAGASDILTVALENGYSSHEAFTRAFREQFGMTPESVRERGTIDGLAAVALPEFRLPGQVRLEPPRIVTEPPRLFVGLAEQCSFEETARIPGQWQRFMEYYGTIDHISEEIPVGVSHPADDEGHFIYMCAVEVSRFGSHPPQLATLEIPARSCAVFEHRGHISTIYATYTAIWNDALPATGRTLAESPVLERHNPTFDTRTGEGGLTLWIPLA